MHIDNRVDLFLTLSAGTFDCCSVVVEWRDSAVEMEHDSTCRVLGRATRLRMDERGVCRLYPDFVRMRYSDSEVVR